MNRLRIGLKHSQLRSYRDGVVRTATPLDGCPLPALAADAVELLQPDRSSARPRVRQGQAFDAPSSHRYNSRADRPCRVLGSPKRQPPEKEDAR